MRVQNPLTYAEKLLSIEHPGQGYSEAKVKERIDALVDHLATLQEP